MNMISRVLSHRKRRPLSYRLVFYVIICSSFFTLLATAVQLYTNYQRDVNAIHANMQFIEESYVPVITASVYNLDEQLLKIQLQGVLRLQDCLRADQRVQGGS